MFGPASYLILVLYLAIPAVIALALYWVIRTAVRDGILAAQDRSAESLAAAERDRTAWARTSVALARDDRAEAGPSDQQP